MLSLVCKGEDDGAIAEALGMSRTTVRNHVARIYGKIGVNKRGAAIVWAENAGLRQRRSSHADLIDFLCN